MRGVVAVFGGICVILVLVVEKLGSVLQLSMSLGAVSNGPLLGIFTMGVLLPWIHGLGAIVGGFTGLSVMAWICARAQAAIHSGELVFAPKPTDTDGCSYTFISDDPMSMLAINTTETLVIEEPIEQEFAIYHISYIWYTLLGALITIVVSAIVTYVTGANDLQKVDPKLLAPLARRFLRTDEKREDPLGTEDDIRYADFVDLKAITTSV